MPPKNKKEAMKRKTYITVDGHECVLEDMYNLMPNAPVSYRNFYQRIKSALKRGYAVSQNFLEMTAFLPQEEWITLLGKGAHKEFFYDGKAFADFSGKTFLNLSVFLDAIEKKHLRQRVAGRLNKGWDIDDAILHPTLLTPVEKGIIYCISSTQTTKQYVGLTTLPANIRFKQHFNSYAKSLRKITSLSPLGQGFKDYGTDTFSIRILEQDVPIDSLAGREIFWIQELNTLHPNGFNRLSGGQIGGGKSKKALHEGNQYSSVRHRNIVLAKKLGLPEHVIDQRLRQGKPLPSQSRRHSKHPESGSSLWRLWKSLLNSIAKKQRSGEVCLEWQPIPDGYEAFKRAVGTRPSMRHKLCRIDQTQPWQLGNVEWLPVEKLMAKNHGKRVDFLGKQFETVKELAEEHQVKRTTLVYRMKKGLSLKDALANPTGKTSPQSIIYDGISFRSKAALYRYLAEKFHITPDQAKGRFVRNIPFDTPNQGKKCIVDGITFDSYAEAARHFGIPYGTIGKRLNNGWSLEEVFGLTPKGKK